MAAAADRGFIAGFFHAQVAMRNSSGYPMGSDTTPNTVANLEVKHAYKLTGPVETAVPAPTRDIATFRGGLGILGQRAMGVSDLGSFDLTLSAYDETFHAMVSGSTVDVATHTELAMTAPNMARADLPQLILLLTIGIQNDSGTNEFLNIIYNNVQIGPAIPAAGQDSGVNPRPQVYTVTPSLSDRMGHGMLYSASALAVQDNRDVGVMIRYLYPLALTSYIDDGIATTFVVGYRPVSTNATNTINVVLKNGVKTNPTSIVTTTGVVTITAGTAADVWSVLYPTEFVSI